MNMNANGKLEEYEVTMQVLRADGRKEPPIVRYVGPDTRKRFYVSLVLALVLVLMVNMLDQTNQKQGYAKFTQLRGKWYNYLRKREIAKTK